MTPEVGKLYYNWCCVYHWRPLQMSKNYKDKRYIIWLVSNIWDESKGQLGPCYGRLCPGFL